MLRLLAISFISCLSLVNINAQAGAHVYGGVMQASFADQAMTPEGLVHPGYKLGVDARLLDGKMYFMLGVQYARYNIAAQEKDYGSFFKSDPRIKEFKYRFGLGFTLIQVPGFKLRAKTMVALHDVLDPDNYNLPEPINEINSYFATADLGIGIDFLKALTFDIEYERGLVDALLDREGSKFSALSATVGVFF